MSCHSFYGQVACTVKLKPNLLSSQHIKNNTYEETTTHFRIGEWPDTGASLLRCFIKLRNWKKQNKNKVEVEETVQ